MENCKNCNEPVNGNFCANCGQPVKLKRIDKYYIIQEIGDFLFAHKGMVYTIKKLLISPGDSVRQFLIEDRYRLVKPIAFLFITSLVYTLVCHYLQINAKDFYMEQPEIEYPTANLLINWMIDYQGYSSIITGLFIALWVKLFFRKSGYNLFEIFVLICFISGMASLFFSVTMIIQGLTHFNLIHISAFIAMIYNTWAIGQFFDKRKVKSYIKAALSCVLGTLVFSFLVSFIAIFIDVVINV